MSGFRQTVRHMVPAALRPVLGGVRRRLIANPLRIGWQRGRLLSNGALDERQRSLLQQIDIRIHHRDGMYAGNGEDYFCVGLSAIECIDDVLSSGSFPEPTDVLDLPCGYGRELRFLVQRFPKAKFTACDIQPAAADFCARAFGAFAVHSKPDVRELSFTGSFDLIWCGSLITHLNRRDTRNLLEVFARYLNPAGVLIVTTNGAFVAERMSSGDTYELPADAISLVLEEYEASGFGYHDYARGAGYFDFHPAGTGYGVSLTSPDAIRELAREVGLKERYFKAAGWAEHQDVFGFALGR